MNEHEDDQGTLEEPSSNQPTPRNSHHRSSSEVDYGIEDDLLKSRSPPPQSTATTKATSTTYATSASASTRTESPAPSAPPPSAAPSRPATSPNSTPATSSAALPTRKPSVPTVPTRKGVNGVPRKQGTNNNHKNSTGGSAQGIGKVLRMISNLTSAIATSLTRNPTQVFRTLMFLFAFLAVMARRDVRERLKNMLGQGWTKVRQTAGMGVRVSYV